MIPRTDAELDKLHQANAITVETLKLIRERIEPGMTTAQLDRIAAGNMKGKLNRTNEPTFQKG